ncbi:protein FAM83A-like [Stegostoma tigrinum]|uniref:protein FAM83A-like n=1 Tax=Stegostoma tigrinum TaxID=3053191 RepID=UPI0028705ADE|nr:protein FAM83A-like [Stegostoma tigrinum]
MMNTQSYWKNKWYQSKNVGKIKRRLEAVKNPWMSAPEFDLSHNESIRFATDALLDVGTEAYDNVLAEEGEVSFLSPSEIQYITSNPKEPLQPEEPQLEGGQTKPGAPDVSSDLTGTYFPLNSDSNGPMLEQGWPMADKRYYLKGPSNIKVYFQTAKSQSIKNILRFYISQAIELIAIVMDIFTDVDIFCDILEAANKRDVAVYILLDQHSLQYFIEMCEKLQITTTHLTNIEIRHVSGDLYCSKSGKKFSGQVQEKFTIIDCLHVLAGSYSFTWLSGQVHRNFITHFSGHIVESFDEEFRRLFSQSKPVSEFSSKQALPRSLPKSSLKTSSGPIITWPESRNTLSNTLSSLSNSSQPSLNIHPFAKGKDLHNQKHNSRAAPQYRLLYTPLLQERNYPFQVDGHLNEIPKPTLNSNRINTLRAQVEDLQNVSRLLPFRQHHMLTDTKLLFNLERTHIGNYSMETPFRLSNLANHKYFNNRYEKHLNQCK